MKSLFAEILAERRAQALEGTVRAAEVVPRPVEWLWDGVIPAAMLVGLFGRPGEGKSTIALDLAARLSREGATVLIVSAEDDRARVLRPRLEAAGADLENVVLWCLEERALDLPDGVDALRGVVEALGAALVILDPINALIGLEVNSHRDHHIRRVFAPLARLAEESGATVLAVGHLNKGASEDPLSRVGGSVAYTAAARQVLLAAADPADDGRRILAVAKSNVGEIPPPIAYRLEGVELEAGIRTSRVVWLGEAPEVDVRALLAPPAREERTLVAEVADALRAILADGPKPARDVERELREALGAEVSKDTLHRARAIAGVVTAKRGFREGWTWSLAAEGSPEGSTPNPVHVESSSRPAQTGSPSPEGSTAGDVRTFEPSSAEDPPSCVRCARYGPDHVGSHTRSWEEVGKP